MNQQEAVVAAARSVLGDAYKWGGEAPPDFDCSGLCEWSYAQIGVSIPRTSEEQAAAGIPVAYSDLQLGDLIIYYPDASHVAMYSGNGNVIEASQPGVPIGEVPIADAGPYLTARRFLTGDPVTTPNIVASGVDYSAGIPGGAAVAAAGYTFACRYVFDGSPGLPYKLLTASEADDLWSNGVDIVSNWESTGTDATGGYAQGIADAQAAQANHAAAGGPDDAMIYFSLDWDESQGQDPAVIEYFQGVNSVIGLARTGAYAGYWPLTRLVTAGVISGQWQTEAWSGDPGELPPEGPDGYYLAPGCNILQRNAAGYDDINGVECDIDIALTDNYGQWHYSGGTVTQPSTDSAVLAQILAVVQDIQVQLRGPGLTGWPQLGTDSEGQALTLVDAFAAVENTLTNLLTIIASLKPETT